MHNNISCTLRPGARPRGVLLGAALLTLLAAHAPAASAAPASAGVLKIGFLGDSITAGVGDNNVPADDAYNQALDGLAQNGYQVTGVNYGNNGASVASFYQQTGGPLQAFEAAGDTVVSVMLGTNDARVGVNTSPQAYHDDLLEIANSFLAPGTGINKVIINYSPYIQQPHQAENTNPQAWDATADVKLQSYQTQINALVNGTTILQGDKYAYQFFQQSPEQGDGVHPNTQGHHDLGRLWAIGITNALGGTNTLAYPAGVGPAPEPSPFACFTVGILGVGALALLAKRRTAQAHDQA